MRLWPLLLLAGCASNMRVVMSDDFEPHDQVLICAYIVKHNALRCMSPQEYQIRVEAAK